jgi:hypothetical protein
MEDQARPSSQIGLVMTEHNTAGVSTETRDRSRNESLLLRKLPYLALLALTIAGVAFTSVTHTPLIRYWELLAVASAIMCIATGWPKYDRQGRFELIWKQAAHWLAIIVAMRIILLPSIQTMLTGPATAYALLLLLALGTFLAGLNISAQICALGLAMALAVPAMLWLKQTALLAILIAAALIGIVAAFWRR